MGRAGKLLGLGKKFPTAAAAVPGMRKQARPLAIPLSVEGAAYLHNAAKGSLNYYQEKRRGAEWKEEENGERVAGSLLFCREREGS